MKKLNITTVLVALALLAGFLFWFTRSTVVAGKAEDRFSSWGYKIEKYRFHRGAWLEIWNSRGLKITYYDPNMTVLKVDEERWLSNQKAIYLNLSLSIKHDSLVTDVPAKILFDYSRGELYVTSSDPLWREGEWAIYRGNSDWMNDSKFQSIVEQLNK